MLKFIPVLALGLLTSCGSSYQRDFKSAVRHAPATPSSVEGPWLGQWKSDMNGHEGPLWCVVTETDPGAYDFRYRAGWGKLQFGDYVHQVAAKPSSEGALKFNGEMDLPGGVGVHMVDGSLTPTAFDATYRSARGDHGTMTLRRPER